MATSEQIWQNSWKRGWEKDMSVSNGEKASLQRRPGACSSQIGRTLEGSGGLWQPPDGDIKLEKDMAGFRQQRVRMCIGESHT